MPCQRAFWGCLITLITDTAPELAFDLDTIDAYHYTLAHWRQGLAIGE